MLIPSFLCVIFIAVVTFIRYYKPKPSGTNHINASESVDNTDISSDNGYPPEIDLPPNYETMGGDNPVFVIDSDLLYCNCDGLPTYEEAKDILDKLENFAIPPPPSYDTLQTSVSSNTSSTNPV